MNRDRAGIRSDPNYDPTITDLKIIRLREEGKVSEKPLYNYMALLPKKFDIYIDQLLAMGAPVVRADRGNPWITFLKAAALPHDGFMKLLNFGLDELWNLDLYSKASYYMVHKNLSWNDVYTMYKGGNKFVIESKSKKTGKKGSRGGRQGAGKTAEYEEFDSASEGVMRADEHVICAGAATKDGNGNSCGTVDSDCDNDK